jgi:N,N-dimethylformamidase beta subunit-like protein/uncharacterized protein DUF4082/fibronectin type III domain protein/Big-like domain-containing protein
MPVNRKRIHSSWRRTLPLSLFVLVATTAIVVLRASGPAVAADPCAPPITSKIACENSKPGYPPSEWQINGIGDESIQGFATSMSVNLGQTINFKIKTPSSNYHINILRLGYYEGDGARLIASNIKPTAKLPQSQPSCLTTASTGLIDCGNWGVSASWTVPTNVVSGLYVAQLIRDDTGGESQIFFVVRDDSSHSDIVLKTADETWQAYNAYGGNSLYSCTAFCPPGDPQGYRAAYAVSYNRPFDGTLVTDSGLSDPLYAEYQLIRFLERNGYEMSYVSQSDVDSGAANLLNHKIFISSGHDEYWASGERKNVETARDAGVNLAFFSGNELFWKTRWETSKDGSNTPYRTLVDYKETHFPEPVDPAGPSVWTGTWRDPRFSPPGDGGRPENSLTGQIFLVNAGTSDIQVPGTFSKLRFWRNTAVSKLSPSQTLTLAPGTGTLGYEWDVNPDNGFRPAGRISMSSTTVGGLQTFNDYGTSVEDPTTATHSLSLYRAPSGALVFGAGTVQWSWGLDLTNAWQNHVTNPNATDVDPTMQQATINLMADMGAQPATLQPGLVTATQSTDTTPPTATITSPAPEASLTDGKTVTISGTASDTGGVVAAVEVSTDNGKTWHTANGTSSWTYAWSPHGAPATTIKARAVDDSANIGAATSGTPVAVACPCSVFGQATPPLVDAGDSGSVELGVKFRSDVAGKVNGIRFYKAAANTGTHVGSLWTSDGTLLAEATFSGESSSGWQQVTFSNPVDIQANTTYVAAYFAPKGHYSATEWALNHPPAIGDDNLDSPPLHILPDASSDNGLYQYSSESTFPTNSFHAENYWVDVLFTPVTPPPLPGQATNVSATAGLGQATVNWAEPTKGGTPTSYRITPYIGANAQAPVTVSAPATSKTITGLSGGTTYTFTVTAINESGPGPESAASNAVTPSSITPPEAPTGVSATAGNLSATVNWTPPVSDGGSPITGYRITPYIGAIAGSPVTAAASATSASVPGLLAGISYTFKVAAVNAVGTGPDSAASNAVTPTIVAVPGAPTGVNASAKNASAQVSWTAPSNNGGSSITGYKITPYVGKSPQTATIVSASPTTANITGLANGTAYTFTVAATNAIGTGAESTPSSAVTPFATIFELATPGQVDSGDSGAVELGVKFSSDTAGTINGIRFYKASTNTGTHVGSLWSSTGTLLAQASFSNESASGWQQVTFSSPVSIQANTTYVAGYFAPKGHYSDNGPTLATAFDNPPLHALANSTSANGVYSYGSSSSFPTNTYQASNYWVDVLFAPPAPPTAPGQVTGVTATAGSGSAKVSWSAPASGGAPTSYIVTPFIGTTAQTPQTVAGSPPATTTTVSGLTPGTAYTFTVQATNGAGSGPVSSPSNAVTPTGAAVPGAPTAVAAGARNQSALVSWTAPVSDGGSAITGYRITPFIGATEQAPTTVSGSATSATVSGLTNGTSYTFTVTAINSIGAGSASTASGAAVPRATIFEQGTPATIDVADSNSVVLGVKFTSDTAGKIRGIRFYKSANNTGTHVVSLWSSTGALLAQATASGESASGWQEVAFSSPVAITANTTYVAGYLAPKGHYSATGQGFSSATNAPPLHALATSTSANGVYAYSSTSTFPTNTYNATNYWVDVLFVP